MAVKTSAKRIADALRHSGKKGAGAKKRKKLNPEEKMTVVMKEWKGGTLHSGSGAIVTNPKQAVAIGMSESGQSDKSKAAKRSRKK